MEKCWITGPIIGLSLSLITLIIFVQSHSFVVIIHVFFADSVSELSTSSHGFHQWKSAGVLTISPRCTTIICWWRLWDAGESTLKSHEVHLKLRWFCQTAASCPPLGLVLWPFTTFNAALFPRFDQRLWTHVLRLPSSGASCPFVQHHEGDQPAAGPAAGHALRPPGPELVRHWILTQWLTCWLIEYLIDLWLI